MILRQPVELPYTDLACNTGPNGRYYTTPDGVKYPSITTVLGSLSEKGIAEWRERVGAEEADKVSRLAAWRGTNVHEAMEYYCAGLEPSEISVLKNPIIKDGFNKLRREADKHLEAVYAQEVSLYSHHLGIAGRTDLIGRWAGQRSVVDWKTSNASKEPYMIEGYFMQGTFYAIAWEEITGQPIKQIVIGIAADDHKDAQIFIGDRDEWAEKLIDVIKTWKETH